MNKYISTLVDYYALHRLHRKKSKVSHFKKPENPPIVIEGYKDFYITPQIPKIKLALKEKQGSLEIGTFTYPSQVKTDWESNDMVTGRYFINNSNKENIHVIMVHGWRTEGFHHFENLFYEDFKGKGFSQYYYTLPHHLDRQAKSSLYSGEHMISADVEGTLTAINQAVTDLRALVKWIKANKGGKVILLGISLGGYFANLTSTLEEEIDGLISLMYANNLAFSIWKTSPGQFIKKDLVENGFTYQGLDSYWRVIDPSCYRPLLPKENILLISGRYDKYVWLEDTDKLWREWDKPKRMVYPCGHAGIVLCRDKIRRDVNDFLGTFLME